MTESRMQEVSESLAKIKAQVQWLCIVYRSEMKDQDWFETSAYSAGFKDWLGETARYSSMTDLAWDLIILEANGKKIEQLEKGSD